MLTRPTKVRNDRQTGQAVRIAYLLDHFPVYSETFITREILELKRKGLDIVLFSRNNTMGSPSFSEVVHPESQGLMKDIFFLTELDRGKSKVHKMLLHLYFAFMNPAGYWAALTVARRADPKIRSLFKSSVVYALRLRQLGIRHIHAHFANDACSLAMLISMIARIPYSFTIHAYDIFDSEFSEVMQRKFINAKFIGCISQYNKDFILGKIPDINKEKLRIIHCGLDPLAFRRQGVKQNGEFSLISVGRLTEKKGFRFLIQACKLLKDKRERSFKCTIIGNGKQREELETLIQEFELGGAVYLLGSLEQTSVVLALQSSDVFVLPCTVLNSGDRDGIPVALMEAMAMGLPVISTNVSGIPELIKNKAGILVEPQSPEVLAGAIERLMDIPAQERNEMGRRGRSIIEREFNLETEVDKLAKLFLN